MLKFTFLLIGQVSWFDEPFDEISRFTDNPNLLIYCVNVTLASALLPIIQCQMWKSFLTDFGGFSQWRERAKRKRVVYREKMTDKLLTRVAMVEVRSGSVVNSKMTLTVSAMFWFGNVPYSSNRCGGTRHWLVSDDGSAVVNALDYERSETGIRIPAITRVRVFFYSSKLGRKSAVPQQQHLQPPVTITADQAPTTITHSRPPQHRYTNLGEGTNDRTITINGQRPSHGSFKQRGLRC